MHPQAGNEWRRNTTAWEKRKRGGLYYTRSLRRDGRIVRRYFGCGPGARSVAGFEAELTQCRLARAEETRREREVPDALREAIHDLSEALQRSVTACLEAEGFHRHKGQWRRKRR